MSQRSDWFLFKVHMRTERWLSDLQCNLKYVKCECTYFDLLLSVSLWELKPGRPPLLHRCVCILTFRSTEVLCAVACSSSSMDTL